MVLGRRPHQRGFAIPALASIDFGAVLEQHPDRIRCAGTRGSQQDGLAFRQRGVRVSANFEQREQCGCVTVNRCQMERRHAVAIRGVGVSAGIEERGDQCRVTAPNGPMQCRRTVRSTGVDVNVGRTDQFQRSRSIAGSDRIDQCRGCLGRDDADELQRRQPEQCQPGEGSLAHKSVRPDQISSKRSELSPMLSIGLPKMPATPSHRFAIDDHSGAIR